MVAVCGASHASAHGLEGRQWTTNVQELCVTAPVVVAALMYIIGLCRLWTQARAPRGIRAWQALCFAAGVVLLLIVAGGPMEQLSGPSFAAHMLEHELLMLAVAPLLVLGRPLAVWLWAFAPAKRRALRQAANRPGLEVIWSAITRPAGAALLQLSLLWLWHVPRLFDAASGHAGLHALQHACFLASALCFWFAVLRGRARGVDAIRAVAWLFVTTLGTGGLGALLTFAPTVWYSGYAATHAALVASPVEDQQLGGLIMWIPGGAVYTAVALYRVGALLLVRDAPRSARARLQRQAA